MSNPFISIKNSWNSYLERLAKANEKTFGGKRPDCCDLNRNQQLYPKNKDPK